MTRPRGPRPAFSIIELLVSISILAVLVAILLPTFSGVRTSAREVLSLSRLRQQGTLIELYTGSGQFYPVGRGAIVYLNNRYAFGIGFLWWQIEDYWHLVTIDGTPLGDTAELWTSPSERSERFTRLINASGASSTDVRSSYIYSNSFVGDPSLWNQAGSPPGPSPLRATRPSEVLFPSNKAIVWDGVVAYRSMASGARPVLHADMSASVHPDTDATTPVQNASRQDTPPRIYHDTPLGVRGQDLP